MNYNDIFVSKNLLSNVPTEINGKMMPTALAVSIIIMQTSCQRKIDEFESFMADVLKKLKKDGFDERTKEVQEMEDVERRLKEYEEWKADDGNERPAKPTDEDVEKARKTRASKESYDRELEDLNNAYAEARAKKSQENVNDAPRMSAETFTQLVDFIGMAGDLDIKWPARGDSTISRSEFLYTVASVMVE